jgi:hypothetical protein
LLDGLHELLAALPVRWVVVTAVDDLLNTQTGHMEASAILSVAIPRETMAKLNLDSVDPSDAIQNFLHRMNFKKTKGFLAVERISPSEVVGS